MPRIAAWEILRSGHPFPLRLVDEKAAQRGLDDRDRGLLRRLIGTEVRRRATLRAMVQHFVHKKPNPDLVANLHLGLVQLFFMDRVPDHAAVNETSGVVHTTCGPSKVRFVNAILRTALRARAEGPAENPRQEIAGRDCHLAEPFLPDPEQHPLLWAESALNIPAALFKGWAKRYGWDNACALGRFTLEEPDLCLRPVGIEREALKAELVAAELDPASGNHANSLRLPLEAVAQIRNSELFQQGRATIQGDFAYSAARLCNAKPGERWLDLCAAPGGKTAVLLEQGAQVLASDSNPQRIPRMQETHERLKLSENVSYLVSDGVEGLAKDASFDGVLVDAPCSNTAVLAGRPGARWRYSPSNQKSLATLQSRLLEEAANHVRSGGTLVYSTCSLEPEENGQRIREFLGKHPEWSRETWIEGRPGDPEGIQRTGPTLVEVEAEGDRVPLTDGGFACRLRRN